MIKFGKKSIWLPHDYYRSMNSTSSKAQFWAITTSCFTILFSLWIGLSLQLMVIDNNKNQADRIAHMQFVDKLYPVYKEYNDSCRLLYEDLLLSIKDSKCYTKEDTTKVLNRWISHIDDFFSAAQKSVEITARVQYYYNDSLHHKIMHNNARLLLSLKMHDLFASKIDSATWFRDSLTTLVYSNKFGFLTLATYDVAPREESIECIDSLTDAFWPLYYIAKKDIFKNPNYYYTKIIIDEILPYLQSNTMILSDEIENTSYKKAENPLLFIIISFLLMIVIGFFFWIVMIGLTFNKDRRKPNPLSEEDIKELKTKVNSLKEEEKSTIIEIKRKQVEIFQNAETNENMKELLDTSNKKLQSLRNIMAEYNNSQID